MIITTAWLEERVACADQVELFGLTFGDGADMNPTNITTAAAAGLDLDWLAERVLPAPAMAEYMRVTAHARAEYERATANAWAEFARVTAHARDEYERVTAPAMAEYMRATAPAWAEYRRVTAHARDEFHRARAPAWAEYRRVMASALIGLLWPEAAGEGGDR